MNRRLSALISQWYSARKVSRNPNTRAIAIVNWLNMMAGESVQLHIVPNAASWCRHNHAPISARIEAGRLRSAFTPNLTWYHYWSQLVWRLIVCNLNWFELSIAFLLVAPSFNVFLGTSLVGIQLHYPLTHPPHLVCEHVRMNVCYTPQKIKWQTFQR